MNVNYELPDDLHRELKIRAAKVGWTLKRLIIYYLRSGLISDEFDPSETDGS